jgi:hypothetical protein
MILLQNSLIKLDYNPATDIMEVDYPDLQGFLLSEVKYSIGLMVDMIRNYDVKKMLIDVSKTIIDIEDEQSRQLSVYLAAELVRTRLQKMARIQPYDANKEVKAQENIKLIQGQGLIRYQVRSFTERQEALKWLQENG